MSSGGMTSSSHHPNNRRTAGSFHPKDSPAGQAQNQVSKKE